MLKAVINAKNYLGYVENSVRLCHNDSTVTSTTGDSVKYEKSPEGIPEPWMITVKHKKEMASDLTFIYCDDIEDNRTKETTNEDAAQAVQEETGPDPEGRVPAGAPEGAGAVLER